MSEILQHVAGYFNGQFIASPEKIQEKLFNIKAFVFDWDGVFNNGMKDEKGSSPFSEVDAMGTNLLRFNHYLRTGEAPVTAIISGEKNHAAFSLAKREHFHAAYYGIKHKVIALQHLCRVLAVKPEEVAFVMDDVLDFSLAELVGLRIFISRKCNPLLLDFAKQEGLADYITEASGDGHAVREASELLCGLSGKYRETISERMGYTNVYQNYLRLRNRTSTQYFTTNPSEQIIAKEPS